MQLKKTSILLFALLSSLYTFSQNSFLLKYFPPNTAGVVSFSIPRLTGKIPREVFRESFIYKQLGDTSKIRLNGLFTDTQNSGIDLDTDLFLVTAVEKPEENRKNFVLLIGKVSNQDLFTKTVQKVFDKKMINTYGTDRMIFDDGGTIAWNKDVFVLIQGGGHNLISYDHVPNDTDVVLIEKEMVETERKIEKAKRDLAFSLLTPRPDNSFLTNARFVEFFNTPTDIRMWNTDAPNPVMSRLGMFSPLSKLGSFTGTARTTIINFENGKIRLQGRNYSPAAVKEVYEKYPQPAISADLARRLPAGKLLGMVNWSYNPQMALELMNKSGLHAIMDSLKKNIPIDLNLFTSSFKGQVLLTAIVPDHIDPADSITAKMDGIQIIMAMPIADKARFEELKTAISPFIDSIKKKDSEKEASKKFDPAVRYNDEVMVVSNSVFAANAYLNNPGKNLIAEELKSYPYAMHVQINLKDLIQELFVKKAKQNRTAGTSELRIMDMLDRLIVYGGNFEKGGITTTTEVIFTDSSGNALQQLFGLINELAETNKKVSPPKNEKIEDEIEKNIQIEINIPARPLTNRWVNDFTNTLTPHQLQALEKKLLTHENSTSNEIAIVLIDRLEGQDIAEYALALRHSWEIGKKDLNNGVVILVAKDDRKVRIEIGYGLEGAIPDKTAKSIIDNSITPNFKKGDFYKGLDQAIDDLMNAADGKYKAPSAKSKN